MALVAWLGLFTVRMAQKDASLRQKPGWQAYKEESWILLPKVYGNTMLSALCYGGAAYFFLTIVTYMPK